MANQNPKATERIPNNLKNIRTEIGITQEKLAKILNVAKELCEVTNPIVTAIS